MSDPIADILERYAKAYPHVHHDRVEQQIRQQIGRELAEEMFNNPAKFPSDIIREVCQMEES